ncbi:MAG: glycosyltransferase family 2 protein [Terriglobales bacterium]|jgi:cellulose synthase/poly-beta-1,6-N-acetylglucosamine synthase-like glycosyltransferase
MKMKYTFWIAAALIGYSYLGYPAWLWLRSRWSPRPVRRGFVESPAAPAVSALMVVRNEEAVIARKLENLLTLDYPQAKLDVVVVSDGSSDRTPSILADYARDSGLPDEDRTGAPSRVRTLLKPVSQGKAAGLNDAIKLASGEVLLFTDARQQIESGALRLLIENFADLDVGAASGELMLGDPISGETEKGMGLYWRIEKKIRELESASGSVAGVTGAIYCARRRLLDESPLPEGAILDDVLLPMQIVRKGFRVIFDARARAWDSPDLGESREFSRKVRTLSGNYQLLQLAPWLLSSENAIRFEFVSHKLSRLAVPFALLALLIASMFLSQPLYRAALGAQLAFYALSLAALAGVKIGPLSRIADPARTFVVLNSAALVAFINFVTGRKAVWVR